MPQRKQIAWAQLRVGVLVLVSMILFAVGIFFIGGQVGFLSRHYILKSYFPSAGGVKEGAEVHLAGIAVGNVHKIQLSPFTDPSRAVEIDMRLTRHYQDQIRSDSIATIETAGLLGESYIDITRGGSGQAIIPDGGQVTGQQPPDIKRIVQNANDVVSNLRVLSTTLNDITNQIQTGNGTIHQFLYDKGLYNRLNDTTAKLDALVTGVQNGEGTLGKLVADQTVYNQAVATLNRLNQIMDDVQHGNGTVAKFISDPTVYNNLQQLTTQANALIDKLNSSQGTLGKLANDPELYNRMNDAMARVNTVADRIDKGEGTLGKLSTDPTLYNNLKDSSASMRDFLTEFRKNPKRYLSIKLHIF